ncbi:MAG TPA: MaoC family dehydratase [Anaeromyxobacteraceae bacterium]|nr:MaoC family dehydratase [Anaeromyxobacteraceae bacterium]
MARALRPGDRAERELVLTREDLMRLASELGDPNPLHHDEALARASRFGGLIASGGHLIGLLTSFCAAFTTPYGPSVGLAFSYELRRAARAGARLVLSWQVVSVAPSTRPRGERVVLEGQIRDGEGALLVSGRGEVLMREVL